MNWRLGSLLVVVACALTACTKDEGVSRRLSGLLASATVPVQSEQWTGPIGVSGGLTRGIAIDPTNPSVIYVTARPVLYKSTDGGNTWVRKTNGLHSHELGAVAIDPRQSSRVFVASADGELYLSSDGGETWLDRGHISPPGTSSALAIAPSDSNVVYVGINGVYKSIDAGSTFQPSGLADVNVTAVVIDATNPAIAYVAAMEGLWKTEDGGNTWTPANDSLLPPPDSTAPNGAILSLAEHPSAPGTLYAVLQGSSVGGGGVFKTEDAAVHWDQVLDYGAITQVTVAPSNANTVYAGGASRFYRSTDGGLNWDGPLFVNDDFGQDGINAMAADPVHSGAVYATGFNCCDHAPGVIKTDDGFGTLHLANAGIGGVMVGVVDPVDSAVLYDTEGWGGAYKSRDGGVTWHRIDSGADGLRLYADWSRIVAPPAPDVSHLYARTSAGVAKSDDRGETWHWSNGGVIDTAVALAVHPSDPNTLYVATTDSLYLSVDAGDTWSWVNGPTTVTQSTVIYSQHFDVAGGLFGTSQDTTIGGPCTPGWSHSQIVNREDGDGTCGGQWRSSAPDDCAVVVHIGVPAFGGKRCDVTALEEQQVQGPPLNVTDLRVDAGGALYVSTKDRGLLMSTDQGQTLGPLNRPVLVTETSDIYSQHFDVPGGVFGTSEDITFGGACTPGWSHSQIVSNEDGQGTCGGQWRSSAPDDCAVVVHIGVPAFGGKRCDVTARQSRQVPGPLNGPGLSDGPFDIDPLAAQPGESPAIYAARGNAVDRSLDAGGSWTQIFPPSPSGTTVNDPAAPFVPSLGGGSLVTDVAVDPLAPEIVYVGTFEEGLFRSADGGDTWAALRGNVYPFRFGCHVSLQPQHPNHLFVSSDGSLGGGEGGYSLTLRPRVRSITPTSAQVGTTLTIDGDYFRSRRGDGNVTLNGLTAPVLSWTDSEIQVGVPPGGASGPVLVSLLGIASNSDVIFTRLAGPASTACGVSADCLSTFCVDEVCCQSACGGGNPNDCQACSVAAGGSADGTCTRRAAGIVCRGIQGVCDVAEVCDGSSLACPSDLFIPAGNETICAPATGLCEAAGYCSGGPTCPGTTTFTGCSTMSVTGCAAGTCDEISVPGGAGADNTVTLDVPGGIELDPPAASGQVSARPAQCDDSALVAGGYKIAENDTDQACWEIAVSTGVHLTADVSDPIIVCITAPNVIVESRKPFFLYHDQGGGFIDQTAFVDYDHGKICASVESLSPFAIVTTIDKTPPVISGIPAQALVAYATSTAGAKVTFPTITAVDDRDGPVSVSCSRASGTTFAPGETTVTCTAKDKQGNTSAPSFTVWVQYQAPADGTFFLQPINPDGSSIFKSGSTAPVKFQLTGASAGITNLAARISVARVSSGVTGSYVETTSNTAPDGGNLFRYDPSARQYIYNLSTKGLAIGTWSIRVALGDLVDHAIVVSLK